jgi:integrase
MKLTKAAVAKLKLPAGKNDHIFWDDEIAGFGLRIRSGGKRTWLLQYRIGSRQHRLKLGTFPTLDADAARKAAKEKRAAVDLGHDPQAERAKARARAAITLGSLVDQFLAFKEPVLRPNSCRAARLYLQVHWRPLHALPIHEVSRRDVAARIVELTSANGLVAASRGRAALSSLFSWAVREGLCENNVVAGTNEPAQPKSRDRVLTDGELAEIWAACRDDDYGRIVKLTLLTACRREEIGGLIWPEADLDRSVLSLSAERTKNGRPHSLPLSPLALAILKSVPRREGREYLFGTGRHGFNGWSRAKVQLDGRILDARSKAAGKKEEPVDAVEPIAPWRVHDLRRTCATVMADRLGVLPHVVEAVLNHVGQRAGVAGTYNRAAYLNEMRHALLRWADHLQSVVEAGEHKIVPLKRA